MIQLDKHGRRRLGKGQVRARLLLTGDLCPIGRPREMLAAGRSADAFGRCVGLFGQADAVAVNLESPLCTVDSPINKCGPAFRCRPAIAAAIADVGVTVACMANNHILDQGPAGLSETLAALDAAGIARCGAGMTTADGAGPLLLDLPGGRLALVNIAEGEFSRSSDGPGAAGLDPVANLRAIAEAAGQADWVVAVVHHGNEQVLFPSPRMRQRCRDLIDAGAHAVVCHHPHVVQGIEEYRGRPIAHSLGNFLFDWPDPEPETDASFVLELGLGDGGVVELAAHPVVKTQDGAVDRMATADAGKFVDLLNDLSAPLADDVRMLRLWEQQCVELAEPRYLNKLRRVTRLEECDDRQRHGLQMWAVNMVLCEAHQEALSTIDRLSAEDRLGDDQGSAELLAGLMTRLKSFSPVVRAEA